MKMNSPEKIAKSWVCVAALGFLLIAPGRAAAQWATNGNNISNTNSGNVGIGTTAPGAKLDVKDTNNFQVTPNQSGAGELPTSVLIDSAGAGLSLLPDGNGAAGPKLFLGYRDTATPMWRSALEIANTSGFGNLLLMRSGGNVGIGTVAPSATLHLFSATVNPMLVLEGSSAISPTLEFRDGAASQNRWRMGSGMITQTDGRFGIYDARQSQYRFIIDTSGSVGVGTTSPGARLDVRANTAAAGSLVGRFGNDNASGGGALRVYANTPASSTLYPAFELTDNTYWLASIAADRTSGLRFRTGSNVSGAESGLSDRMVITATGNVGIGTGSPASPAGFAKMMHLSGASNASYVVDAGGTSRAEFAVSSTGGWLSTADNLPFRFATNNVERMRIGSSGTVGIGTATPNSNYKLDVNGDTNVTGSFNASGTITGGTIVAKYQDVAEWVPASHALSAGTVVTLDPTKSNHVEASTHAYDTRVAGVVSAQPGITLGQQSDNKVLVATTGRVKVMVDAASGPIEVGDLLVTSDIEGVAKKSEPLLLGGVPIHRPGTLIGKALEPLARGRGEILVLLSLQ